MLQIFSAPAQEGNLLVLSKILAQKKLYNFSIKLNHLCRTSRRVWLSSSACDRCCAYQLICITTISTYTTSVRAHFFTVQEPSKRVIFALVPVVFYEYIAGKSFFIHFIEEKIRFNVT